MRPPLKFSAEKNWISRTSVAENLFSCVLINTTIVKCWILFKACALNGKYHVVGRRIIQGCLPRKTDKHGAKNDKSFRGSKAKVCVHCIIIIFFTSHSQRVNISKAYITLTSGLCDNGIKSLGGLAFNPYIVVKNSFKNSKITLS